MSQYELLELLELLDEKDCSRKQYIICIRNRQQCIQPSICPRFSPVNTYFYFIILFIRLVLHPFLKIGQVLLCIGENLLLFHIAVVKAIHWFVKEPIKIFLKRGVWYIPEKGKEESGSLVLVSSSSLLM